MQSKNYKIWQKYINYCNSDLCIIFHLAQHRRCMCTTNLFQKYFPTFCIIYKIIVSVCQNFCTEVAYFVFFPHRSLEQNGFHQLGLMRSFPRLPISVLLSIENLYGLPCVTISCLGYETFTTESKDSSLSRTTFKIWFGPL